MEKALIFKIQKFCTDDGPGIRTTVFFKGCPLNCLWCHNPEGLSNKPILAIDFSKCVNCGACANVCSCHSLLENKHRYSAENCVVCGKCIDVCKAKAIDICGVYMSVDEIMKQVMADKFFYQSSGGGITISGGEPLMQSDFARELLKTAKEKGIHTCVETSSGVSFEKIEKVMDYVDLFLCDVKETNNHNHKKFIGVGNKLIIENIKKLNEHGKKMILRCPIIPSVNDNTEHFDNLIELYNLLENAVSIQLMPYHLLGQGKSQRYGIDLTDTAFIPADTQTVKSWNEYIQKGIRSKNNA